MSASSTPPSLPHPPVEPGGANTLRAALRRWPHGIFAVVYGTGLFAFTITAYTGLPRDELEAVFHAQSWAWSYDPEQPPLFEWALRLLISLFGSDGTAALWMSAAIKMSAFGLFLWSIGSAAQQMIDGPDRPKSLTAIGGVPSGTARLSKPMASGWGAGLCVALACLLTVPLGFEIVFLYTHSVLLLAAVGLTMLGMVKVANQGRVKDYALVGLALGLGALSKYTFVVFAVGLLAAAIVHPVLRRRLLSAKLLVSLGVAAALVLPHAIAKGVAFMGVVDRAASITSQDPGLALPFRLLALIEDGLLDPVFAALPALLVIGLMSPLAWVPYRLLPRHRRTNSIAAPSTIGRTAIDGPDRIRQWGLFVALYALVSVLVVIVITTILGGDRLRHHYVMPVIACLPMWAVLRFYATVPSARRARILTGLLIGLCPLVPAAAGFTQAIREPQNCDRCLTSLPVDQAAQSLRNSGFTHGTIIDGSLDWGANLLLRLPDTRLLSTTFPDYTPPPLPQTVAEETEPGQCVVLLTRLEARNAADGTPSDLGPLWDRVGQRLAMDPVDVARAYQAEGAPITALYLPLRASAPDGPTLPFGFLFSPAGIGDCR